MRTMKLGEIVVVFVIIVVGIALGGVAFRGCGGGWHEKCVQSVGNRPCLAGTVEYDGDWECECLTEHGELEWDLHPGCDVD